MSGKSAGYHGTYFSYCNDIAAMRAFYIDILNLPETFYDAEKGWLTCDSGMLNLVFIQAPDPLPVTSGWARQPAFAGGTELAPSWVFNLPDAVFDATLARIKAADIPLHRAEPATPQPGHRSIWVRDPMGTTLEIYAAADQ